MMKKLTAIFLTVCMLMLTLCMTSGAISLNASRDELDAQFLDGEANGMDYVYFSPVKNADNTKYPILIWLHGNVSGSEPRRQIKYRGYSNWLTEEYQARFKDCGGCFLLFPRANSVNNSWDGVTNANLKKTLDEFVSKYSNNVDTSRIYLAGNSVGADKVWSMVLGYPDYFAAAIPCSAVTPPTAVDVKKLTDTSVWMVNSENDFWVGARANNIKPVFNSLKDVTNRPDGIRSTTLSDVVLASGKKQGSYQEEHYTNETITYDMHMSDRVTPYKNATTVDGTGATINFDNPEIGVIDWLYKQTNTKAEAPSNNENAFVRFFRMIWEFILSIFKR